MGESSTIILENSQFQGNIHQKYIEGFCTIILENFLQNIWENFTNFGVICVTNILGKIPQKIQCHGIE